MTDHAKRIAQNKTRQANVVYELVQDWSFRVVMSGAALVVAADTFGWLK